MGIKDQVETALLQAEHQHPRCVEYIISALGGVSTLGQRVTTGNELMALAQDGFSLQALNSFITGLSPDISPDSAAQIRGILPTACGRDHGDRLTAGASMKLLSLAYALALATIVTGSVAGACEYMFLPHPELVGRRPFDVTTIDGDLDAAVSPLIRALNGFPA
ncbi:MAG: hypothetical protein EP335_06885 [Alphaproteobacteria bacterium]|nr:MAG: hypothetical protein EP335_06885 [Alphaproteobacteria bacterium]